MEAMPHSQILTELDRLDMEIRSRLVWASLFGREPNGLVGLRQRRDELEDQLRHTAPSEPAHVLARVFEGSTA